MDNSTSQALRQVEDAIKKARHELDSKRGELMRLEKKISEQQRYLSNFETQADRLKAEINKLEKAEVDNQRELKRIHDGGTK